MSTYRAWGMDSRGGGWWEKAACREHDPELWTTAAQSDGAQLDRNRRAIAICRGCPVAADCLAEAERMGSKGIIAAGIKLGARGPSPAAKTRVCRRAGCGVMFTSRIPNALYCSDECRNKIRYMQEAARRRAYKARQRAAVSV